jgi:hypothetical protein
MANIKGHTHYFTKGWTVLENYKKRSDMMEVLAIIIVLGFINMTLWIIWKATEARENLKKNIDRVIEEIRKK